MIKLIKGIQEILDTFVGSFIKIEFFVDNEIYFLIYDNEIPIIVDLNKKEVRLDCETINYSLTGDMLNELSQIVKLLENNIDMLVELKWKKEDKEKENK